MSNRTSDGIRNWILGAVATGMILPSMPAFAQTRNSNFVNPKNSARKSNPVQTGEPPRLLVVPDGGSTSPSKQTASQIIPTAGEKSEVQKQLDSLYEQDGREPPNFNLQPLQPLTAQPQQSNPVTTVPTGRPGQPTAATAQKPARPVQGYISYQPRTQATPYIRPSATNSPRNAGSAIDAQSQAPSQLPAQFPTQPQTPPQYLPQYQQHRNPMTGLFRRLTGANKYAAMQAPVPPDIHDSGLGMRQSAAMPMSTKYAAQTGAAVQPVQPHPVLATTRAPIQTFINVQNIGETTSIPAELPPIVALPALSEVPLQLNLAVTEQTGLPPLMTELQATKIAAKSAPELVKDSHAATDLSAEFPNPFTEVTETEADMKFQKPTKATAVALDVPESPHESKNAESNSPPRATANSDDVPIKAEEDPYAVKAKDFSEPSIDEKLAPGAATVAPQASQAPQSLQSDPPPASATMPETGLPQANDPPTAADAIPSSEFVPQVAPPSTGSSPIVPPHTVVDPQVEKMKRIRERFGMKGLKGFCPVTLHDERELVDARTEFHFTHRSQKFHFSTAEARDKFETNPSKYAPAAYGADVVALSRDKDVVEGTLDYAAWFKGRLYLFGTQANYDAFIAAPSKFATLAEIE